MSSANEQAQSMNLVAAEPTIHNGQILNEPAGVQTEPVPAPGLAPEDIEPEALAALMAACLSDQLAVIPQPSPMAIVTALLKLKTTRGHKVVWTRFDIHQMFALWSSKMAPRAGAR